MDKMLDFLVRVTRTVRSGVIQGRSRVVSAIENFSRNEPRVKDVLFRVLKQMRDENERSKANLLVGPSIFTSVRPTSPDSWTSTPEWPLRTLLKPFLKVGHRGANL